MSPPSRPAFAWVSCPERSQGTRGIRFLRPQHTDAHATTVHSKSSDWSSMSWSRCDPLLVGYPLFNHGALLPGHASPTALRTVPAGFRSRHSTRSESRGRCVQAECRPDPDSGNWRQLPARLNHRVGIEGGVRVPVLADVVPVTASAMTRDDVTEFATPTFTTLI